MNARMLPLLVFGCSLGSGCGPTVTPNDGVVTEDEGSGFFDSNDSFSSAHAVALSLDSVTRIGGVIEEQDDVDVYDLGLFRAGEHVIVDVGLTTDALDVAVGLFDDFGRIIAMNDDEDASAGMSDSLLDAVLPRGCTPLFLAVAAAPKSPSAGEYEISVTIDREGLRPQPSRQVFVLDFDGGGVEVEPGRTVTIDPFDAGEIDVSLTDLTQEIRDGVVAAFRARLSEFDIEVRSSPDLPEDGDAFSTILVGGSTTLLADVDTDTLGFAPGGVDYSNTDRSDTAVVFANSFSLELLAGTASTDDIALTIGNVAAHEAGHLLGLSHTDSTGTLMDFASAATFLNEFLRVGFGSLDETVFPIGTQDSALSLKEVVGQYARPFSIVDGDLDGDGDVDLMTANLESRDVAIMSNDATGGFVTVASYVAGFVLDTPHAVVAADFDDDGDLDLAAANTGDRGLAVLLNDGDGTFGPRVNYEPDGAWSLVAGDVDGDGDVDLVILRSFLGGMVLALNDGDGGFSDMTAFEEGTEPERGVLADFDGDGSLDLAVVDRGGDGEDGDLTLYANDGRASFVRVDRLTVGSRPVSVVAGDWDGDGDADLAVANLGDDQVAMLFNEDGAGLFGDPMAYDTSDDPWSLAAADLDGDGDLDLAVAARSDAGELSILLNGGDGVFADSVSVAAGVDPVSVAAADFDGDGDVDLAVANGGTFELSYRDGGVSVLLNEGAGVFSDAVAFAVGTSGR